MLALSSMIGALVLSRIVTDDKRSKDILKQMRLHLTEGG
jgi:TetR/AcrR family transcriptional repressor of nem operon